MDISKCFEELLHNQERVVAMKIRKTGSMQEKVMAIC